MDNYFSYFLFNPFNYTRKEPQVPIWNTVSILNENTYYVLVQ